MTIRITVASLIGAAVVHLAGTLLVGTNEYNTFALVLEVVLVVLGLLAGTGRWWVLGIVGLFSGLLAGYTAANVVGSLDEFVAGQVLVAALFVAATGTGAISGLLGAFGHARDMRLAGAKTL